MRSCVPARRVDDIDRLRECEPILADIRGASAAEISVERIAKIDGPTFGDHRTRDVRAPDGAARGLLQDSAELEPDAELIQAYDDALCARVSHRSKRRELRLDRTRIRDMQSEDVRLRIV